MRMIEWLNDGSQQIHFFVLKSACFPRNYCNPPPPPTKKKYKFLGDPGEKMVVFVIFYVQTHQTHIFRNNTFKWILVQKTLYYT